MLLELSSPMYVGYHGQYFDLLRLLHMGENLLKGTTYF